MKRTLPPHLWIALAYLVIAMLTVSHYGLTWDEGVQSRYGELVLRYFASRFEDGSAIEFLNLQLYGPLFESSAAAVYRFFPEHEIDIRHALIAFTGFLTILGAGVACARLGGSGGLASLALLMTPQFYGHSFNNSKDIPFACAATWFFVALLSPLERKRPRDVVLLGLAGGAMLGIRVGGLLLVAIAAVIVALTRERRLHLPRDSFAVQKTMSRGATLALDDTFDYYVATTRYGLHLNYPQTRIAAVMERDGAVFTVIRGGCRPANP